MQLSRNLSQNTIGVAGTLPPLKPTESTSYPGMVVPELPELNYVQIRIMKETLDRLQNEANIRNRTIVDGLAEFEIVVPRTELSSSPRVLSNIAFAMKNSVEPALLGESSGNAPKNKSNLLSRFSCGKLNCNKAACSAHCHLSRKTKERHREINEACMIIYVDSSDKYKFENYLDQNIYNLSYCQVFNAEYKKRFGDLGSGCRRVYQIESDFEADGRPMHNDTKTIRVFYRLSKLDDILLHYFNINVSICQRVDLARNGFFGMCEWLIYRGKEMTEFDKVKKRCAFMDKLRKMFSK
jgi:hypothetical protein